MEKYSTHNREHSSKLFIVKIVRVAPVLMLTDADSQGPQRAVCSNGQQSCYVKAPH